MQTENEDEEKLSHRNFVHVFFFSRSNGHLF